MDPSPGGRRVRALGPRELGPAALVVAAGLALCAPLLWHAPNLPDGNDVLFAVHAATGFTEALQQGTLYPRWIESSSLGLGAPIFLFYPPLCFYLVGALAVATGGVSAALTGAFLVLALLAGVAFALAFRSLAPAGAVAIGAALYVLAPYHALDLYWRVALAEYAAFVWIPLLLLAIRRVVDGAGADGVLGLAASYAGLVLTHVVTAYLAPLALAPYVLVRLARSGRWTRLVPLAAGGVLAAALAGAYGVPFAVQRDHVQLDWARDAPYGDYRRNFVARDETRFGYEAAPIKPWVGRAAAAQALLAAAALAALALGRRRSADEVAPPRAVPIDEILAHTTVSAWVLLLQLPPSEPLWRVVPELATAQFPWRFQIFQVASACVLVTLALGGPRRRLAQAVCFAAAIPALWLTAEIATARDFSLTPAHARAPAVRQLVIREYLPTGAPAPEQLPRNLPRARLEGGGSLRVERWDHHERRFRVSAPSPDRLVVRTFAFPGWKAWVDEREVPVRFHTPPGATPTVALVAVDVPAGDHTVRFAFAPTWDRTLGAGITLGGAAVAGLLGIRRWRRRRGDADPAARRHSA